MQRSDAVFLTRKYDMLIEKERQLKQEKKENNLKIRNLKREIKQKEREKERSLQEAADKEALNNQDIVVIYDKGANKLMSFIVALILLVAVAFLAIVIVWGYAR